MKQLIPWATSAVTLLGMYLVGNKNWWGWIVGLVNQVLWIALALAFATWGLLPLSACLIVLYARNLWLWRKAEIPASQKEEGS